MTSRRGNRHTYSITYFFFIFFLVCVLCILHITQLAPQKPRFVILFSASISRLAMASGRGHRHTPSITFFLFFSFVLYILHIIQLAPQKLRFHLLLQHRFRDWEWRVGEGTGIPIQSPICVSFFFRVCVLCILHITQLAPQKLRFVIIFWHRFRDWEW